MPIITHIHNFRRAFSAAGNPALLKKTNIDYVKPEQVKL
jgi:hypothetical protein